MGKTRRGDFNFLFINSIISVLNWVDLSVFILAVHSDLNEFNSGQHDGLSSCLPKKVWL